MRALRRNAEDGEWLYDMVWWQGDQNNHVLRNVMVLELELRRGAKDRDGLNDDFPKLVQARTRRQGLDFNVAQQCTPAH